MKIDLDEAQHFVNWLSTKMYLNSVADNCARRYIKRGEVYWCHFGYNIGNEIRKMTPRPCVIVQNDIANAYASTVIVCPITHTERCAPYLVDFEPYVDKGNNTLLDGKVNITGITCVSKARLTDSVIDGRLNNQVMEQIDIAIMRQLNIIAMYNDMEKKCDSQNKKIKKLFAKNAERKEQLQYIYDYFGVDNFKDLKNLLEEKS